MTAPVSTTIDRRYSDPAAKATSWAETVRVLERRRSGTAGGRCRRTRAASPIRG